MRSPSRQPIPVPFLFPVVMRISIDDCDGTAVDPGTTLNQSAKIHLDPPTTANMCAKDYKALNDPGQPKAQSPASAT
jgi:hypothetical protein